MVNLTRSEFRLFRRAVLRPWLRPAALSEDLGLSRSAVSQLLRNLVRKTGFRIKGLLKYPLLDMTVVFGWAQSEGDTKTLGKFTRWLQSRPSVYATARSVLTSMMDNRVYFEALLHRDRELSWFLTQLRRFTRKPYLLDVLFETSTGPQHSFYLADFDGSSWNIDLSFRFEAAMSAARNYTDIFPESEDEPTSAKVGSLTPADLAILTVLEDNYFATYDDAAAEIRLHGLPVPRGRTLRRRLALLKKSLVRPYVFVRDIGLPERVIVSVQDWSEGRRITRLLEGRFSQFPYARLLSGDQLSLFDLSLPASVDVAHFAQSLVRLAGGDAQICASVTEDRIVGKELLPVLRQAVQLRIRQASPLTARTAS
ncbi:MAG: hypothetical protein ACTSYX_01685 [Candidatus Thorarchaeota archaeon]